MLLREATLTLQHAVERNLAWALKSRRSPVCAYSCTVDRCLEMGLQRKVLGQFRTSDNIHGA